MHYYCDYDLLGALLECHHTNDHRMIACIITLGEIM